MSSRAHEKQRRKSQRVMGGDAPRPVKCDFCGAIGPAYRDYFPPGNAMISEMGAPGEEPSKVLLTGHWAACRGCDVFLQREDLDGLFERTWEQDFATKRAADAAGAGKDELRGVMQSVWRSLLREQPVLRPGPCVLRIGGGPNSDRYFAGFDAREPEGFRTTADPEDAYRCQDWTAADAIAQQIGAQRSEDGPRFLLVLEPSR